MTLTFFKTGGSRALMDSHARITTAGTIGFLKKTPAVMKTAP